MRWKRTLPSPSTFFFRSMPHFSHNKWINYIKRFFAWVMPKKNMKWKNFIRTAVHSSYQDTGYSLKPTNFFPFLMKFKNNDNDDTTASLVFFIFFAFFTIFFYILLPFPFILHYFYILFTLSLHHHWIYWMNVGVWCVCVGGTCNRWRKCKIKTKNLCSSVCVLLYTMHSLGVHLKGNNKKSYLLRCGLWTFMVTIIIK